MNNENNKEDQSTKDKIIKDYLDAENKIEAIRDLAKEYEYTERHIRRILGDEGINPPSKFRNVPTDVFNDTIIIEDTVLAKIEEYWGDRKDISLKNKDVAYGILKSWEIKYGMDSWKVFEDFIINTEKILAKTELEKALQDIKENKNPFETFESVLQDFTETSAREILKSLQQPPETPETRAPPPKKPFLNDQFIENFLAIKNPMFYRLYKIMKGEPDPLIPITNILEQIKKLSPKEREKLFSGVKKS